MMKIIKLEQQENASFDVYHCYDEGANEVDARDCVYLLANTPESVEKFIDDCDGEYCRGLYQYTASNKHTVKQRLFAFDSDENIWREIPDGLIQVIKKRMTRG